MPPDEDESAERIQAMYRARQARKGFESDNQQVPLFICSDMQTEGTVAGPGRHLAQIAVTQGRAVALARQQGRAARRRCVR